MSPSVIDLGILVDLGKELPSLLRRAKKGHVQANVDIQEKVKNVVITVLESIKSAPVNTYFPRESVENLVKKIKGSLEEFIRHDPEYKLTYEDLIKVVDAFEYQKPVSASSWSSSIVDPMQSTSGSDEPVIDISVIKELDDDEYRCLCCFLLFPPNTDIMKRDIIHCWIGMDMDRFSSNEHLLAKFVEKGLIEQTVHKKRLLGRYKMPASVHSILCQQTNTVTSNKKWRSWPTLCKTISNKGNEAKTKKKSFLQRIISFIKQPFRKNKLKKEVFLDKNSTENDNPSTIHPSTNENHQPVSIDSRENVHPKTVLPDITVDPKGYPNKYSLETRETICRTEMLLNVDETTLDAEQFKKISKMKKVTVLHLGSWHLNCKKYIVVKDVGALRHLKRLSNVRFLSLAGLSRIVNLPKYVYKLKTLKVLDLRACNDLELLPGGIESLNCLTHLDISGCYLLDHVPYGISSLTDLQVLKGFIVNVNQTKPSNAKALSSSCPFGELSKLNKLTKLTIITRRSNFPTPLDTETFSKMEKLSCLKITWIGNFHEKVLTDRDISKPFPSTLTKLELQAAQNPIASRVLGLISKDTGPEKLYIRVGGLRQLDHSFSRPRVVRLLYLPELRIHWDDFRKKFPNMDRLEVLDCPNLELFPCADNGVWVNTCS